MKPACGRPRGADASPGSNPGNHTTGTAMTKQALISNVRTLRLRLEGTILLAKLIATSVALAFVGFSLLSLAQIILG